MIAESLFTSFPLLSPAGTLNGFIRDSLWRFERHATIPFQRDGRTAENANRCLTVVGVIIEVLFTPTTARSAFVHVENLA